MTSVEPGPPEMHQLDLLAFAVDDRTATILDCIAGDLTHERDRERIFAAIMADAEAHEGEIDLDRVRPALSTDDGQLLVYPRLLGAVVSGLARTDVIRFDHWKASEDIHGRNQSKPARVWRLADRP